MHGSITVLAFIYFHVQSDGLPTRRERLKDIEQGAEGCGHVID